MDWKLELVTVPVSDVDRAKAFYAEMVGFVADHDHTVSDELRFVQLTPPDRPARLRSARGSWTRLPARSRVCSWWWRTSIRHGRNCSSVGWRSTRSRSFPGRLVRDWGTEQPSYGAYRAGREQGQHDATAQHEQSDGRGSEHGVLPCLAQSAGEWDS